MKAEILLHKFLAQGDIQYVDTKVETYIREIDNHKNFLSFPYYSQYSHTSEYL